MSSCSKTFLAALSVLSAGAAALHVATPSITDLAALSAGAEELGSLYEKEMKSQPSAEEQRQTLSLANAAEIATLVCAMLKSRVWQMRVQLGVC